MYFLDILAFARILVFLTLAVRPFSAKPLTKDQIREAAKDLFDSCKSESGATDDDLEALSNHKMPESREGMCMVECVFTKTNMMENGKFSRDGMVQAFQPLIGNDTKKQKSMEELASTCEKEIGKGVEDKCENAKLLVDCLVKHGKNHGFNIPTKK